MEKENKIEVFKLGGAFFDAKYVVKFFKVFNDKKNRLYVVSAIRGITRLLESVYFTKIQKDVRREYKKKIIDISILEFERIHIDFIRALFKKNECRIPEKRFKHLVDDLKSTIYKEHKNKDQHYAEIIKFGELASSQILSLYIDSIGINNILFDARDYVKTTNDYHNANILYIYGNFRSFFSKTRTLITQGFIGRTDEGKDTALGYDGSDKSAAEFAIKCSYFVSQIELTFWKDVDGVFKGDPKMNQNLEILHDITYKEYEELWNENGTGPVRLDSIISLAKAKRNIIVKVSSYDDLDKIGTVIHN